MPAKPRPLQLSFGLHKFSGLYLFALFVVVFGIWKPGLFLSWDTAHSIASEQVIIAMIALGVLIPLATGTYDLSVGATANLSAIVAAWLQDNYHMGPGPAIVFAVLVGAAIGIMNGFIVVRLRVSSFIATLGTASIVAAVETIVANGSQPLPPSSNAWDDLTQFNVGGFQIVVAYMLVLAIVLWWFLDHTPAGRYLFAVGGNYEAARLAGVRVDRWVCVSLVMSGTICGLAGVLFASQNGPSLTFGAAMLLPAYAAAFLGSTQLKPGRFNVWGTLIAVYALATGVQGIQFVTGAQWLNDMFNGVALVAAVAFAVWRQRARSKSVPAASTEGSQSSPADPAPRGEATSSRPLPDSV
jgi:ribose transport system permease protein